MDRKTFILRVARGGLLLSMAGVAGVLFSRKQVVAERGCGSGLPCRHCPKLNSCRLPAAKKYRGDEKE